MFEIGEEVYFKVGIEGMESCREVYNTSKAEIIDKIISFEHRGQNLYLIQAIDLKGREGDKGVQFWYPEWLITRN